MSPPYLQPSLPPAHPWRRLLISVALVMGCAGTALLMPIEHPAESLPVQAQLKTSTPAL